MKNIVACFFIFLLFLSCSEANTDQQDIFILGITFGECGGDCAHFYKLEDNSIFPDNESGHWWAGQGIPSFKNDALDNNTAFMNMQSLLSDFPIYLTETTEEIFGCPDCADGGAIHVMREIDGEKQWWTLDNDISKNPEELQVWTRRVRDFLFSLIN